MKKIVLIALAFGVGVLTSAILIYFKAPQVVVSITSAFVTAFLVRNVLMNNN